MRFDVIVAGLGAMGSAIAWQLARSGATVLGLDRFHPPHAHGSSTGRSRIIREAYFENPFYVPLVRRAFSLWDALEQESGRPLLQRTGGLVIGPEGGDLITGALRSAEEHAVPVERLRASEVRARYPFQPGDDLTAVFEPHAGVLTPEDCIEAMLTQAGRHGAELRYGEPVLAWGPLEGGGAWVRTDAGQFEAGRLVLAAGAWMAGALPQLGRDRLPLEVARQVMFWFQPAAPAEWAPQHCPIWLWETHGGPTYYGFPDTGAGAKVARHHGGMVVDPQTVERGVSAEDGQEVSAFLASAIPSLAGPPVDAQVCLYTNTPDEHFVLDVHPDHTEVMLVSPCSGHGFKFAPTIGEIVADWSLGDPPRYDLSPFRLSRFGGGGTG